MRSHRKRASAIALFFAFLFCIENLSAANPHNICYSIAPNPYLDAHAADIKKIYDGFFFVVGSWENLTQRFVGAAVTPPQDQAWLQAARKNVASLCAAGVRKI